VTGASVVMQWGQDRGCVRAWVGDMPYALVTRSDMVLAAAAALLCGALCWHAGVFRGRRRCKRAKARCMHIVICAGGWFISTHHWLCLMLFLLVSAGICSPPCSGDATSSIMAPPYSTTVSTNLWSVYCNRYGVLLRLKAAHCLVAAATSCQAACVPSSRPSPQADHVTQIHAVC
jgi:hypothetical protein